MILQLKASQGKGWSETYIKDAIKQGIFTGAPIEKHLGVVGLHLRWWLQTLYKPRTIHSVPKEPYGHNGILQTRDPSFCSKVGSAIDTSIFRWLEQWSRQEDRKAINDNIINFQPILDMVLMDSFVQQVPNSFSTFHKQQQNEKEEPSRSHEKRRKLAQQ